VISQVGKSMRMKRVIDAQGVSVICALDHGMTSPTFLEPLADIAERTAEAVAGGANVIMMSKGMIRIAAPAFSPSTSLALLLSAARRHQAFAWASLARDAAQRFSTLGIVSVATLLVTGIASAWILVGSFQALLVTEYGLLLMLKIVVFAIMLVFAAVNRFWLTPQLALSSGNKAQLPALRRLMRNSVIEIALGFTIFVIVGALGTLHPAIHGL